jgi:hypothetical protein
MQVVYTPSTYPRAKTVVRENRKYYSCYCRLTNQTCLFTYTYQLCLGGTIRFPVEDQKFIDLNAEVVIVAPCGLDIPTTERELRSIIDKNKSSGAHCWVTEYLDNGIKIAVVDGNQMFNRPGPRLVDAMEFLVGFINNRHDLVPSDFPWKLFTP